jgi:hypothetical protein
MRKQMITLLRLIHRQIKVTLPICHQDTLATYPQRDSAMTSYPQRDSAMTSYPQRNSATATYPQRNSAMASLIPLSRQSAKWGKGKLLKE